MSYHNMRLSTDLFSCTQIHEESNIDREKALCAGSLDAAGDLSRSVHRRFAERVPLGIGLGFIFLPLAGYYLAPYLLISQHPALPPYVFGIVLFLYVTGIFFHYVSDAQKFYILRERKGLIEDGLFARTRNPNYLGEILIYLSFAIMSMHWIPFVVLGAWVFGFFARNMLGKDKSLARHPGFAEYKARTGLLIPRVFPVAVHTGSRPLGQKGLQAGQ